MVGLSYFHRICLSNILHFLWLNSCNEPTRDVGRTQKNLVNHEPEVGELTFLVFSEHPKWVYYASKPIENVVYCS